VVRRLLRSACAAGLPVFKNGSNALTCQPRALLSTLSLKLLTMRALTHWAAIAVLATSAGSGAAELSNQAQAEISKLLDRIESSNCSFGRNGDWYPPAEARKHLQMKLDYMVKRNMLGSTEEFISKAATASSVSGEAYQIRCGSQPAMASATWLTAELKRIRSSS